MGMGVVGKVPTTLLGIAGTTAVKTLSFYNNTVTQSSHKVNCAFSPPEILG
jgi:hypothetical protein